MSRGRSGTKSKIQLGIKRQNLSAAKKGFTRVRAEKAINAENCNEARFTGHRNYHVKRKAWVLAGRPLPEGKEDRNTLLKSLHLPIPEEAAE